jgi:predicted dienelactone hydrolase
MSEPIRLGALRVIVGVGLLALGLSMVPGAVGSAGATGRSADARATSAQETHAVGVVTDTFVDTTRSTPAWDGQPVLPQRTLVTTIWYPVTGPFSSGQPKSGAAPDLGGGPFPLIVFAHGLGADPLDYQSLLSYWAAAGFVVAAPQFPLTSDHTPGGTDEGDVVNQPGDISFVITSVLKEAATAGDPLSGLVDSHEIGAAGHSNGAITTLALAADTCCLDRRIKAAEILAGDEVSFPGGHFDFATAPPLLLVHGTADALLPYPQAIAIYNQARGPKALLTIKGGSHESAAGFSAPSAASVRRTTTDFFAAYVAGDRAALNRFPTDAQKGATTLRFSPKVGSRDTITTLPPPVLHLHASATPHADLASGQVVTVQWSGYTAGKVVNILECAASDLKSNSSSACSFAHAKILTPDPTGKGSLTFEVVEGPVGTGVCNATHQGCLIVVNNASSTATTSSVRIPISFSG